MYTIYTEIHENGTTERWYYGTYADRDRGRVARIPLRLQSRGSRGPRRTEPAPLMGAGSGPIYAT